MLGQFLRIPQSFEILMICLGQEDGIEEIILQTGIRWHDAVSNELDHCMKGPHSAIIRIFWSRPVEGAVVL